jgi:uncharacterized protein (TIGR03437 family)
VTTPEGLFTFGRDGRRRSFVSLDGFAFMGVPSVSTDSAGAIWLVGKDASGQMLVAKLTAGGTEQWRWTLPVSSGYLTLNSPFFGPDGYAYLAGTGIGTLQYTTPNALLEAPCGVHTDLGVLAVLSATGEVKLLSYLPSEPYSFAANAQGGVLVTWVPAGAPTLLDLSLAPKASCVVDSLDRFYGAPAFGAGQVVRLRGGGFGPSTQVNATPGGNQVFSTLFSGLTVTVGGTPAPILSAGPGEVVFEIPFATQPGSSVPVIVQSQGQPTAPLVIAVQEAAPWPIEPILNADGTPNSPSAPASWGSTVTILLTGAGPYAPPLADGQVAPSGTSVVLTMPVSASFLSLGPTPEVASIVYAGPAPGQIGVARIDVQLPSSQPVTSIIPTLTIGTAPAYIQTIWVK